MSKVDLMSNAAISAPIAPSLAIAGGASATVPVANISSHDNAPLSVITLAERADELLDIEAVCKFFGGTKPLHPATIYRGLGTRYPRPIRVSPNINRWLRSECEAALRAILEIPRQPLRSPKHGRGPK